MEVVLSNSIAAVLEKASEHLASVEYPVLEAELLLAHVLGRPRGHIRSHPERELTPAELTQLIRLIERRLQGEPAAYLTGHREFWSLDLQITRDVLIPRPETERLVELALERIPENEAWRIADLGTGSGAIALALARERPRCRIVATDVCAAALEVARANAERLNILNIEFRLGDWFAPLRGERFDLIVANPPYVADGDPHLHDLRFEPRSALVAGADGLQCLCTIINGARAHLAPQGWLLLEHGYDQAPQLLRMLADLGYAYIHDYTDLAGVPRIAAANGKPHE